MLLQGHVWMLQSNNILLEKKQAFCVSNVKVATSSNQGVRTLGHIVYIPDLCLFPVCEVEVVCGCRILNNTESCVCVCVLV